MFSFHRNRRVTVLPEIQSEPFPYPLSPCPAIAVYPPYVRSGSVRDLASAGTLAAPMEIIRALDPRAWSPKYPIVVFSDLNLGRIRDDDRDYIWRTFGVPVFEYLLDREGQIIARECEAHEGLHLDRAHDSDTKDVVVNLDVIDDPCPCGRAGSRLLSVAANSGADVII